MTLGVLLLLLLPAGRVHRRERTGLRELPVQVLQCKQAFPRGRMQERYPAGLLWMVFERQVSLEREVRGVRLRWVG